MVDLTNIDEIRKLDPKDVFGSTGKFLDQCVQIHEHLKMYTFKQNFSGVKNIVFSGMGGSSYGAHVVLPLFKYVLDVPVYINNDYDLPEFVDEDSLVIVASYSGATDEALSALEEAKKRSALIIILTSGGKLAENVKDTGYDAIVFEAKNNPSGQPRLGTGYMVLGTIEILRKIKMIDIADDTMTSAIDEVGLLHENIKEKARELSEKTDGSIPVIFAAGHLTGNIHIMRNQFNETSKSFASYHEIPEANHHLLEGLKNPTGRKLIALLLNSGLYSDINKKRMSLTGEVFEKNETRVLNYDAQGKTNLTQVLEILMLGGYLTFYLGILYGQDPSLIPWVDFFKEKLKT